jgi:carbamoyltransferase
MSIILGISGGFAHRIGSPAACLVINGKLEFAQEEERLNRIKNSIGLMPTYAIKEALKYKKLNIRDVNYIAFHSNYPKLLKKIQSYFVFNFGYCPKIKFVDHHTSHAYSAYFPSGFKKANIITMDYSGNGVSTTISKAKGNKIKKIKEIRKPNSLRNFLWLWSLRLWDLKLTTTSIQGDGISFIRKIKITTLIKYLKCKQKDDYSIKSKNYKSR